MQSMTSQFVQDEFMNTNITFGITLADERIFNLTFHECSEYCSASLFVLNLDIMCYKNDMMTGELKQQS